MEEHREKMPRGRNTLSKCNALVEQPGRQGRGGSRSKAWADKSCSKCDEKPLGIFTRRRCALTFILKRLLWL